MKRPMAEIGFMLLLGGIISYFISIKLFFIFLILAAISVFSIFICRLEKKGKYILMILCFCMGMMIFKINYYYNIESADKFSGEIHTYTAEIKSVSNYENSNLYKAKIISIDDEKIKENYGITFFSKEFYDKFDIVKINSYIYKNRNETFLEETYNISNNFVFFGNTLTFEEKIGTSQNNFEKKIDCLRNIMYSRIDNIYEKDQGGILKGIILGDKSDLKSSDYFHIKRVGLAHLFAASGFNLSVFVGFVMLILSFFRINKKIKSIIGIIVIILFAALAGFTPSILRAGFMYGVVLLSDIFNERSDTLNSLGFAVFILYLLNPLICINISFLLSVSAILGIVIISKSINIYVRKSLKLKNLKIKNIILVISDMISTGFGACIATIPVMILFFKNISLLSPVTSVIFVYPVQFIFIAGIISILLPSWTAFEFLSHCVEFVIKEQSKLIEFISSLNIGIISLNPFFIISALLICAVIITLCFIKPKNKTIKKTIALITCAFILVICVVSSIFNINRLTLSFIDVGQGDSVLLKYNGQNILFDAGGTKSYQAITDTLNDVKIDYLIVSHYHDDHINYIDNLQKTVKVQTIIAPPAETSNEEEILNDFKKHSNTVIALNDVTMENDELTLRIFTHHAAFEKSDPNAGSLVTFIKYKDFSALITGDLEFEGEGHFLEEYNKLDLDVDVLKVGHHGSKSATSKKFLDNIRPEISIISAGENNKYNHPEEALLQRLYSCGSKIYRTDKDSTVTVSTYGEKYYIH